ncbi:hypothetical protein HDU96_002330, partial [Phlyctochytrium bullatum]
MKIFDGEQASNLSAINVSNRYFKVSGFKFCETLNNATFDSLAYINPWKMTVAEKAPTVGEFKLLIEDQARKSMMFLMMNNRFLSIKVCLPTVDLSNVSEGNRKVCLLQCGRRREQFHGSIDLTAPAIYRANIVLQICFACICTKNIKDIGASQEVQGTKMSLSGSYLHVTDLKPFQIAFLIMVHGDASMLENVKYLVEELDDGSAILLIHVDLKSEELYNAVAKYVVEREALINAFRRPNSDPLPGNVHLAEYRYYGRWGHISLVWIQLSGFWELLDLADFSHVINLSGFNFPLRKAREIQRILSLPEYREKNFISHWAQY